MQNLAEYFNTHSLKTEKGEGFLLFPERIKLNEPFTSLQKLILFNPELPM